MISILSVVIYSLLNDMCATFLAKKNHLKTRGILIQSCWCKTVCLMIGQYFSPYVKYVVFLIFIYGNICINIFLNDNNSFFTKIVQYLQFIISIISHFNLLQTCSVYQLILMLQTCSVQQFIQMCLLVGNQRFNETVIDLFGFV